MENVNLDVLLIQFSQVIKVVRGGEPQLEDKNCHYKSSQLGLVAVINCTAPRWVSWDCHCVQGKVISHHFPTFIPIDRCIDPSIS